MKVESKRRTEVLCGDRVVCTRAVVSVCLSVRGLTITLNNRDLIYSDIAAISLGSDGFESYLRGRGDRGVSLRVGKVSITSVVNVCIRCR